MARPQPRFFVPFVTSWWRIADATRNTLPVRECPIAEGHLEPRLRDFPRRRHEGHEEGSAEPAPAVDGAWPRAAASLPTGNAIRANINDSKLRTDRPASPSLPSLTRQRTLQRQGAGCPVELGDDGGACTRSHSLGSHRHALPAPIRRACRESNHLPNSHATMNGRVNGIHPEQYPPVPALSRNETPPYPRLSGTNNRRSTT